ncbi:MAG: hypothetical protein LBU90_08510 [Bacteroidales bacterium]|jgi:hypothetical protein|nr:hypothetical protein [Bacteroidales bacterium]
MKKMTITLAIVLVGASIYFSSCRKKEDPSKNNTNIVAVLTDAPAHIVKGCFEMFSRTDTLSLVLDNYPQGVISIFPSAEIPESYRVENLTVFVSGYIFDSLNFNACLMSSTNRLAPVHLFELTNIKSDSR